MKRKITLLLLAAASVVTMNAQVMLSEDFTSPFNIGVNDWQVVDNTVPLGVTSWTQGNQTGGNGYIPAYNGGYNDFYMADFTTVNSNTSPGTISAFLITPTLTIYNGAILQFATSTLNQGPGFTYPDRLQVLMSPTNNTLIPTGVTSVGTFTNQLLDINPNLTTNNTGVVSNGTVNGYPFDWTVYTIPVTGVTGTVTGRFAFRYYVTNAGVAGLNSRLVGVDAVRYTLPCAPTVQSFTVCSSASTTLQANGGLSTTTYSWSTGATTSSIVVSPASTTTYTLYPSVLGAASCGNVVTASVTVNPGAQTGINVTASSPTICAGETLTLTASGATSYTWAIGTTPIGSAPSITVAPSATTNYSVIGQNGFCGGLNSIQVTVTPIPTTSILATSTIQCVSGPSVAVTFTGSGAGDYVWLTSGSPPISGGGIIYTIPAQTATTPATQTVGIVLIGQDPSGCSSDDVFILTVARAPVVTVSASITGTVCTNSSVTLVGDGADSYSWIGAITSTDNPVTYPTGSVAATKHFTLIGTDATTGCAGKTVFSQNVVICNTSTLGIATANGYEETSIFPNPFSSEIKINVLDGTVIIFNALGQAVLSTEVRSSETINTTDLPKGVYLVKAYNTNGELVKSSKLVKN